MKNSRSSQPGWNAEYATGVAPTETQFDCRPYRTSANETCLVTLNADAPVHIMLRGYARSSTFTLTAAAQP